MTITDAATFCATLVDEWARAGVSDAFVAPGSRSTPLALALATDDRLRVHVFHDERAASFAALGHGLTTGRPAVLLCTSGTAAAHFHAAVIEADLSSIPMIVCTADRPPELWDVGAPQTIDQTHLYGSAVRFFAEPGVPDGSAAGSWRSLGSRAVAEATGWSSRPGPVHLNLSFRDPLVGSPGPLPPGRSDDRPWHQIGAQSSTSGRPSGAPLPVELPPLVRAGRAVSGVIIAGAGTPDPSTVLALAGRLGWPVLADHRSGCRADTATDLATATDTVESAGAAVSSFDSLLRVPEFARSVQPALVLRFGEALASKVLGQWLADLGAETVSVIGRTRWSDPDRITGTTLVGPDIPGRLLDSLPDTVEPADDLARWRRADDVATRAVAEALAAGPGAPVSEIEIARRVVASVPAGGALVAASSMPVRDVEWFGPPRADIDVFANRGANGIDGTIATAIGVALTGRPTTVLIGDVAFLHDSTALIGLTGRTIDLRIVVIDNDGGGIFSFLPQAELLEPAVYEQLFGTPHGTDLEALALAHRLTVTDVGSIDDPPAGVTVTIVTSNRSANATTHRRLNDAVAAAVTRLLG